jgi:hypothetical protein
MTKGQEKTSGDAIGDVWGAFWVLVLWCIGGLLLCGVLSVAKAAEPERAKFALTFDKVTLQQLVMVFYDQCEKKGLLFDPAVTKLEDVVTLKTPRMSCGQTRPILLDALARAGLGIEVKNGYDVVRQLPGKDEREGWRESIYRPKFRDAVELAEQAQIAVRKGFFAHQRRGAQVQVTAPGEQVPEAGANGATITGKPVDKLVFFGPEAEVKAVESLLSRLDVPNPQVELKAGIYEFQRGKAEGSGVDAVVKLFSEKLGITINSGALGAGGSAVKVSLPSLDAALSLLDTDSRFRYVARPKVLARDGEPVHFFAGEDVRVVGAIVLDRNGNPIQSKETLSAGVTLEATPRIRGEVVDVSLYQAVSNFAAGASGDPSVLKRDLRSRLVMQPGAVYVIGGLQSSRKTQGQQRFFGFRVGNDDQDAETEIVLLLTIAPDQTGI